MAKASATDGGVISEDEENKIRTYPSPYADTFPICVRLLRPYPTKTKADNNDTGIRNKKI